MVREINSCSVERAKSKKGLKATQEGAAIHRGVSFCQSTSPNRPMSYTVMAQKVVNDFVLIIVYEFGDDG